MGGFSQFLGDLTGGLIGESTAERAAKEGKALSEYAKREILGELGASWEDVKGYMEPWLEEGERGLSMYKQAIGAAPDAPVFEGFSFDPSQIEENPAYQFVRDQGLQAVERQAAKTRGLMSGNIQTAIADYASGLASTEYGNEFQRQLQAYQTGETAKARNFDVRNLLARQRVGDTQYLASLGPTFGTNLATFRERLAGQRAGAQSGYVAEQAAASLIPVQERQNFMNNLAMITAAGLSGAQQMMTGGGGGAMAMSDRRLKTNITKLGTLDNGLNWYAFDYIWGGYSEGVMADEVIEIVPDAVFVHPSGYYMVDYSRIH